MDITPQTNTIEITPQAAQAVQELIAQRNLSGYSLRIFVAGQSCCGLQYGMALDRDIRDTDFTFETHGIQIVVDEVSMEYLAGARIDYINDEHGQGFAIENPNTSASCACGGNNTGGCGCGGH